MALADRGRRLGLFLPLTYTFSVTARLLATVLLALARWPDTAGPPAAVTRRRAACRAGFTTVPRERMRRRKPLLTSLQETNPRTAMGRDLRLYRRAIMLDHGPRRAPTPEGQVPAAELLLRSGALWTAHLLLVQHRSSLITPPPLFHPLLGIACHLAPISPRFVRARLGPLIPRNWPPFSPRLTASQPRHCRPRIGGRNCRWRGSAQQEREGHHLSAGIGGNFASARPAGIGSGRAAGMKILWAFVALHHPGPSTIPDRDHPRKRRVNARCFHAASPRLKRGPSSQFRSASA